jgi:hypothetical protein
MLWHLRLENWLARVKERRKERGAKKGTERGERQSSLSIATFGRCCGLKLRLAHPPLIHITCGQVAAEGNRLLV